MLCATSPSDTWSTYCVGKNPGIDWYDANNSGLKIQMQDRRVSIYQNQYCFDCNAEDYKSGICGFASDYFPDHARVVETNNDFVGDMVLKCPFKSLTRNEQRYLDTIEWERLDAAKHTSYTK